MPTRGRKPTKKKTKSPYSHAEKIIDKIDLRESDEKQILYRVRWPNSWEPEVNLQGLDVLETFLNGVEGEDSDTDIDDDPMMLDGEHGIDEVKWQVRNILKQRKVRGQVQYYVKWKDTWVWGNDLKDNPKLIRKFDEAEREKLEAEQQRSQNNDEHVYHEFDDSLQMDSNGNHEVMATNSNGKRKRNNDEIDTRAANTSQLTVRAQQVDVRENNLRIVVDDDTIDKVLARCIHFGEAMFLFERLNHGEGLVPVKVAHIKYPDAVMDFYEKFIDI